MSDIYDVRDFGAVGDGVSRPLDSEGVLWASLPQIPELRTRIRNEYLAYLQWLRDTNEVDPHGIVGADPPDEGAAWDSRNFARFYDRDWLGIQAALLTAADSGGIVMIPPGEYRLSRGLYTRGAVGLDVRGARSSWLRWRDGHSFRDLAKTGSTQTLMTFANCSGLNVSELNLDGLRYGITDPNHLPLTIRDQNGQLLPPDEWEVRKVPATGRFAFEEGNGLQISGSRQVRVVASIVRDVWGTSFSTVNGSRDVTFDACLSVRPRRTAFSVTRGERVRVVGCTGFVAHNGFLDVEPNLATDSVRDCVFDANTYHDADTGLGPELRLPAAQAIANADEAFYLDAGIEAIGDTNYKVFRGDCAILQCGGNAERILFRGNRATQHSTSTLIVVGGNDVVIADCSFWFEHQVEQMIRFLADANSSVRLSGNTFEGAVSPAADAAKQQVSWMLNGGLQRDVSVVDNRFINVGGAFFLLYGGACRVTGNTWIGVPGGFATDPPDGLPEPRAFVAVTPDKAPGVASTIFVDGAPVQIVTRKESGDLWFERNQISVHGALVGLRLTTGKSAFVTGNTFDGSAGEGPLRETSFVIGTQSVHVDDLWAPLASFELSGVNIARWTGPAQGAPGFVEVGLRGFATERGDGQVAAIALSEQNVFARSLVTAGYQSESSHG